MYLSSKDSTANKCVILRNKNKKWAQAFLLQYYFKELYIKVIG